MTKINVNTITPAAKEVVKDCFAVDLAIVSKLGELIIDSNNKRPVTRFGCNEILCSYRVMKCLDELSKDFLRNSISLISGSLEDLKQYFILRPCVKDVG